MTRTIRAVDLFCGAGGTSTGLVQACEEAEHRLELLAVNHWSVAVETHSMNHPAAHHLCQTIDTIDPRKAVRGGQLDVLIASPECTHHSIARGGRPKNEQSRASAWCILKWLDALDVGEVRIENVKEFAKWGPLYPDDYHIAELRGKPIPEEEGKYFRNFIRNLRCLGYSVSTRVLNCADYGDPTTRHRLFIAAKKGSGRIRWPQPSHRRPGSDDLELYGGLPTWRAARTVIDWSLPTFSIFDPTRKRPCANTMRRIEAGILRFCGEYAEPFLVVLRRNQDAMSLDLPLPTITTSGAHLVLCQPFVIGQQSGSVPRSSDEPLPTISTSGALGFVQPFIVPNYGERNGQTPRTHSVDDPMPAVTSHGAGALVQTYLVRYNGTGTVCSVDEPLPTITTKDRFGIVTVSVDGMKHDVGICKRMFADHELAAGQGFPPGYKFAGTKTDIKRQIGNAVPVHTAKALCRELIR